MVTTNGGRYFGYIIRRAELNGTTRKGQYQEPKFALPIASRGISGTINTQEGTSRI